MIKKPNLEEKIIKKVYQFEERRTISALFKYFLAILTFLLLSFFSLQVFVSILNEQQTFDLLELFKEDFETIKNYFGDVLATFYEELPKQEFLVFLFFLVILAFVLLLFTKNYQRIKNRLLLIWKKRSVKTKTA